MLALGSKSALLKSQPYQISLCCAISGWMERCGGVEWRGLLSRTHPLSFPFLREADYALEIWQLLGWQQNGFSLQRPDTGVIVFKPKHVLSDLAHFQVSHLGFLIWFWVLTWPNILIWILTENKIILLGCSLTHSTEFWIQTWQNCVPHTCYKGSVMAVNIKNKLLRLKSSGMQ